MDIQNLRRIQYLEYYVLCAGVAVLGILANAVFYSTFLRAQSKKYSVLSARTAEYASQWNNYENFPKISEEMDQIQNRAREISRAFGALVNKPASTDRMAMSEMENIRQKAGIAINSYSPEENGLRISFNTSYAKTVQFLSLLGQTFTLNKISMGGDGDAPAHSVTVSVVRSTQAVTRDPSADFFALYAEAKEIVSRTEDALNVSHSSSTFKDPFLVRGTIYPAETAKKFRKAVPKPVVVKPPDIAIESIVWDKDSPLVIIKSKIYREGDVTEEGARIVKIHPKMVTVNWKNVDFDFITERKETQ